MRVERENKNMHDVQGEERCTKRRMLNKPGFEVLDLRAQESCFFPVLADLSLIFLNLLALPLQLVDKVVLDD